VVEPLQLTPGISVESKTALPVAITKEVNDIKDSSPNSILSLKELYGDARLEMDGHWRLS